MGFCCCACEICEGIDSPTATLTIQNYDDVDPPGDCDYAGFNGNYSLAIYPSELMYQQFYFLGFNTYIQQKDCQIGFTGDFIVEWCGPPFGAAGLSIRVFISYDIETNTTHVWALLHQVDYRIFDHLYYGTATGQIDCTNATINLTTELFKTFYADETWDDSVLRIILSFP